MVAWEVLLLESKQLPIPAAASIRPSIDRREAEAARLAEEIQKQHISSLVSDLTPGQGV